MLEWTLGEYLERLSARDPVPAGGVMAALILAQGAALLAMVARSVGAVDVVSRAETLRADGVRIAEDDAVVVEGFLAARRTDGLAAALLAAAGPPAQVVRAGAEVIDLCERIAPAVSAAIAPDLAAAAQAAAAAARISLANVEADIAPSRGTADADRLATEMAGVDDLLRRVVRRD